MWFNKNPNADQGRARAQETLQALENHVLPEHVERRLASQKAQELPWTSDLSVNEWLLLKQYGCKPLGFVMGSAYYRMGFSKWNYAGSNNSYEVIQLSRAMREVRELALQRLTREAEALGAHAVVGVRFNRLEADLDGGDVEFVAYGTAITFPNLDKREKTLLCTVSAIDLIKLFQVNTVPVGLALGVCCWYQYSDYRTRMKQMSWYNQEIRSSTEAVYEARHRGMRDLERDARGYGGTGVLADKTHFHVQEIEVKMPNDQERTDYVVDFLAIGTIVSTGPVPKVQVKPMMTLD